MYYDVFNGDADGICALVQLRLAQPVDATLITGVKRDIQLLGQVSPQGGDNITVLDISLDKNRTALDKVLAAGARVFYVDHHQASDIFQHKNLITLINTDATVCTSLLIDQHLAGKYRAWAVTAAFGDNLLDSARQAALALSLNESQLMQLEQLGVCINYNAYGDSVADLHFSPDALYRELAPYSSPFDFMANNVNTYQRLVAGYQDDMAQALRIAPEHATNSIAVYMLPDAAWARRISGVFGNELANRQPNRAHAVLSFTSQGDYQVSVRSPLSNKTGADELCSAFATGGGRKSAAGINHLPLSSLSEFITAFAKQYR
jgi:hypothetical protein